MKSAKEWATETVSLCDHPDVEEYRVDLGDDDGMLWMSCKNSKHAKLDYDTARGIIERLVERVQVDARSPLEEEIARLEALVRGLRVDVDTWKAIARDGDDP